MARKKKETACTYPNPYARLVIPTSFEDCLTYGQRQAYMWSIIEDLDRRVKALEEAQPEPTP